MLFSCANFVVENMKILLNNCAANYNNSESLREQFSTCLTNYYDMYLCNLDDEHFMNTLLGAPLHIDSNKETLKCSVTEEM